ncbi:hypothetical protein HanIR_Chr10g0499531 [Helianthus annuus]|nr:hypothetical protein HanIR_Chr10g0499531 [Helianthus annuus]
MTDIYFYGFRLMENIYFLGFIFGCNTRCRYHIDTVENQTDTGRNSTATPGYFTS